MVLLPLLSFWVHPLAYSQGCFILILFSSSALPYTILIVIQTAAFYSLNQDPPFPSFKSAVQSHLLWKNFPVLQKEMINFQIDHYTTPSGFPSQHVFKCLA